MTASPDSVQQQQAKFCGMSEEPMATIMPFTRCDSATSYPPTSMYTYRDYEKKELIKVKVRYYTRRPKPQMTAKLQVFERDGKRLFTYGDPLPKELNSWNKKTQLNCVYYSSRRVLEVAMVFLGTTRGICTKSVAHTIHALVNFANDHGKYAKYGEVEVYSQMPCRAFNCYNRAFRINGFRLEDNKLYDNFNKVYETWDPSDDEKGLKYTFAYYGNERQRELERVSESVKKLGPIDKKAQLKL